MASSRSEENVNLSHFQHMMVSVLVRPAIFLDSLYFILVMADVLAIDLWQCDVTGRCYCHVAIMFETCVFCLADVVAMLLCCFRIDGDVLTIRLMFLALFTDVIVILVVVGVTTLISSCTRKCANIVLLFGRCYCQNCLAWVWMADGIAIGSIL